MTMDEPPPDALGWLQWNWGTAYAITGAADRWMARRRDNGRLVIGSNPDELRGRLLADYRDQAVPREVAP
jgi:hypothetical protein